LLGFIGRARDQSCSISETTELANLRRDKGRRNAEVKALAQARVRVRVRVRVRDLRHKIAHLQDVAHTFEDMAIACAGNERPHWPILHQLELPGNRLRL
jgi:MerR family gold-responsive transcriptional activator of gol and ges genes